MRSGKFSVDLAVEGPNKCPEGTGYPWAAEFIPKVFAWMMFSNSMISQR